MIWEGLFIRSGDRDIGKPDDLVIARDPGDRTIEGNSRRPALGTPGVQYAKLFFILFKHIQT
jgi:hypothetical protein